MATAHTLHTFLTPLHTTSPTYSLTSPSLFSAAPQVLKATDRTPQSNHAYEISHCLTHIHTHTQTHASFTTSSALTARFDGLTRARLPGRHSHYEGWPLTLIQGQLFKALYRKCEYCALDAKQGWKECPLRPRAPSIGQHASAISPHRMMCQPQ